MNDPIQQALQNLAPQSTITRQLAVFFGAYLVFLIGAAWVIVAVARRRQLTLATIARILLMLVLAFAAAKVLTHLVVDPRPYILEHTQPLTPTSRDNGFPSDHVLLAAALTASLAWFARRFISLFAAATLLVMVGRLAVEAHHTIDVVGSVGIVLVATLLVSALPLPVAWQRPALPGAVERKAA
ncbi:MAG: phosphatase PAP2 family protein [Ktedonobacterales bacterium]|nr:phosphatase PAP2 family protein [Ktedonobacterales bacterium]